jgi:general secretion pathway protein F
VALAVIVMVVAPNLAELFVDAGGRPPPRIALLLQFAAAAKIALPLFVAILVFVAIGLMLLGRTDEGRRRRDALILRLPLIGGLLRSRDCARFASTAALMIGCGLVPTTALPLSVATVRNISIRARLDRAITDASQGMPLQEALRRSGALPADLVALIGAGLRAGRLGDVLGHGGALHAERARARVERIAALLTPAITVFAGVVVGGLAYLVMTAVLSLNEIALQ